MSATMHHGDCLDVMRDMPDASVDAVITDPPYGIGAGVVRGNGVVTSLPSWDAHTTDWILPASRVLRAGGSVLAFCDTRRPGELWNALAAAGLHGRQIVYWFKHATPPNPRRSFQSAVEVAVWATKGVTGEWKGGALTPNVWFGNIVKANRAHPTQKPIDLMDWLVGLLSAPGGIVLDPFAGSGTTGVACVQTGRSFIGVESEAAYAEIARKRIADAQSQLTLAVA